MKEFAFQCFFFFLGGGGFSVATHWTYVNVQGEATELSKIIAASEACWIRGGCKLFSYQGTLLVRSRNFWKVLERKTFEKLLFIYSKTAFHILYEQELLQILTLPASIRDKKKKLT